MTGVCGAAACSALFWVVRRLVPSHAIAGVAALAFASSEVMWSQSLIADVYALNVLLFFVLVAQAFSYLESPTRRSAAGLGLVYGLSLSVHWPLIGLATPCLALILWPQRRALVRDSRLNKRWLH